MNRTLLNGILLCLALSTWTITGCGDGASVKVTTKDSTATKPDTAHDHAEGEHTEDEHAHGEEGHDEHAESAEIAMTPEMIKEAGIVVEAVRRQPVSAPTMAPGRVVPTQNGVAHVGTVTPGRITRLIVSEGSFVSKGSPLAELEATGVGDLKGEYLTARAAAEQTRLALARQEQLSKEGIGARRTLEEARAAHAQANAALRATESKLRNVGINPSSVGSGAFSSRITLRAPISGTVARRSVVIGEYLEPNKDAFEIVNTATVWVDAQVSSDVASSLQTGSAGFIRDRDDHRHAGQITFISPTVDPQSRTVTVRVEVSNPDVHMRPETFVNVEFERSTAGMALAVPSSAIEQEGTEYFVYREHEPNVFQRVPVEISSRTNERTVIASGVKEGDRLAVSGLFYLKSARQSGELEEHHH